jgi:amidase
VQRASLEDCLARIAEREEVVQAWAFIDPQQVRKKPRSRVDGILAGIPVGVKDILDTADMPTEYGTPIYAGHRPAWDAACVALVRAAGGVILGKTVTTEFATMTPGKTRHPLDPSRTPGGSSSGSAAAVADGMVPFAFGTQTVGSIIRPAAYCGVVGYKPSFGTIARAGMKVGCESLDTIGVIAKTVEDAALLTAVSANRKDLERVESVKKPRLGVCRTPNWPRMMAEGIRKFEETIERLVAAGATVVEREMDAGFDGLDAAASAILCYEIARGLAHEMAHYRARIGPALVERVDSGLAMPHARYAQALALAADCRRRLADLARDIDAFVTPSATGEAQVGLGSTGDTSMNRLWTLLHGPCVTVPAGSGPAGMPLGIQLAGLAGGDARTLAVARWVESVF